MSSKLNVQIFIKELMKNYGIMYDKFERANKSEDFTDTGKLKVKSAAIEDFNKSKEFYLDKIKAEFDQCHIKNNEANKIKPGTLEYQVNLSNVIKSLELCSATMDRELICKLIMPYVQDEMAINMFLAILGNTNREDLKYINTETIKSTLNIKANKLLTSLQEQLEVVSNPDFDIYDTNDLALAASYGKDYFLTGCLDYLENNFDEDLNEIKLVF